MTIVHSFKAHGIDATPVIVEIEITQGIGIHLVGLVDVSVKETLLRTLTAMDSVFYRLPGKKVIINLAPADLRKSGLGYDLPIALGVIAESKQEPLVHLDDYVIAGELGLDATVRAIPGWLQCAMVAKEQGKACLLPKESAKLAARVFKDSVKIYGVNSLRDAIAILNGETPEKTAFEELEEEPSTAKENTWAPLRGQEGAKRALEIAAAGGHPLFLVGAPRTNMETLAKALVDILPPMSEKEIIETQSIASVVNARISPQRRPFRAPHFSSSLMAILGGGAEGNTRPGEVSRAHCGVLYLKDWNLAPKSVLEALRCPLEDRSVTIARLKTKETFPAHFFPVMSMSPCPCGEYGEGDECTCTPSQRMQYLARINGPIYDRLTVQLWCHPQSENGAAGDPAEVVAKRVAIAREIQLARQGKLNDDLTAVEVMALIRTDQNEELDEFLSNLIVRLNLSVSAYSRIVRLARTIADLESEKDITKTHLVEAATYRFLDRSEI
jgi:magnesium chelatase family protein